MPKATRKKKEKAADFSKSKLKLGKGKQLPTNAVDTSFKARSIALPSQSIASSKPTSEPTTKRKLSLDDLIAQLKHYSPSTRRDALSGLRELLTAHPSLLLPALPRLLTSTARLISDDDQSVRKGLLSLLSYVLPTAGANALAPHAPSLLLFTASAQTHIFPAVALDAVRLLDLLLDILPEAVATQRVLEGYLSLLSAGTAFGADELGEAKATSTASVVLSPQSRSVVLKSLARFLRVFLGQEGKNDKDGLDTSFLRPHFSSEKAYEAFDSLLRPQKAPLAVWTPRADAADDFFVCEVGGGFELDAGPSLRDLSSLTTDEQDGGLSYQARIARTLHPVLLAAFLDAAPSAFSPGAPGPEHDLAITRAVSEIYLALYTSAPSDIPLDELQTFLSHMAPYFPFRGSNAATGRKEREDALEVLDLAYCALAARLLSAPPQASKRAQSQARTLASSASTHLASLLNAASTPADGLSSARGPSASAYAALVPAVWALLSSSGAKGKAEKMKGKGKGRDAMDIDQDEKVEDADVLRAALAHAARVPATSAVGALSREFTARLVLLETAPGFASPSPLTLPSDLVETWALGLPCALWELGGAPAQTARTLRIVLRLAQRRALNGAVWNKIAERLAPFFSASHPTRGAFPGPYAKLGNAERRLALDVAATVGSCVTEGGVRERLDAAVARAIAGLPDQGAGTGVSVGDGEYWASVRAIV
ncbi:hypothetical protein PENSPDRAFT_649670 [Peniophora sp. CONT]|nr:hypothetical protein PENSPDRAFT_649670 [Peniophora sp. CONT]